MDRALSRTRSGGRRRATRLAVGVLTVALLGSVASPATALEGTPGAAAIRSLPGQGTAAESGVAAYVTAVYADLFGRAPDPDGLRTWTALLLGGTPLVAVANSITNSAEFRSGLITDAYGSYLGRTADGPGAAHWLASMNGGLTIVDLEIGFTASDEYYAKAGGTPAAWVGQLYGDILDREAASPEVAYWVGELAGGASRSAVSRGFLNSTEHLRDILNGYYTSLLGRTIDPSGAATWVAALQRGQRIETVIGSVVSSNEYFVSVTGSDPAALDAGRTCAAPISSACWELVEDVDLSSSQGWQLESSRASNTSSQDLPANVSFSASGLTIVGKRETTPDGSRFSSGDAKGTGHPIPNYARVEVVGRGPSAPGLWPAVLWLRPLGASDGEIDLMENFGGQPRVKATLHNQYGTGHAMIGGTVQWSVLANPDPNALHTYVMEKTPDRIRILVDGVVLLDAGPGDAPPGFDWERIFENPAQSWYPRVTMQIGCGTANPSCDTGSPSDSFTSTDMRIVSLRIYRLAD